MGVPPALAHNVPDGGLYFCEISRFPSFFSSFAFRTVIVMSNVLATPMNILLLKARQSRIPALVKIHKFDRETK